MLKWSFLKKRSVLGIEVTTSQFRIVEAIAGPRLKILKAVTANYFRGDQGTVAGQLRDLLRQEGIQSKSVHVAVAGPSVVHSLISLPMLKKSEMSPVVNREVRKISSLASNEQAAGFQVVGETTERGINKSRVLIAGASSAAVNHVTGLLEAAGLEIKGVSITPIALLNAIQLLSGPPDEGTIAHIKLGLETSHIIAVRQGMLQFSREIPLGLRGSPETAANFMDRLLKEIKRTALYYRQNFRGEEIRRIILSGDDADLRRFTGPILDELGIEVSIYDPTPSLDLDAFEEGPIKFRETAHNYVVPLGLTWEPKSHSRINLVPAEVSRKGTVRFQRVAMLVAASAVIVGLVLGYFLLAGRVQQRRQRVSTLNAQVRNLEPRIQQIQDEQRLREIHKVRLAFLRGGSQQGPVLAKALQEFSLMIPDEMLFRSVRVDKRPRKWSITITGEVVHSSAPKAQAVFTRFFSELRASKLFYDATLLQPLQISTFEESPAEGGSPKTVSNRVQQRTPTPRPAVVQTRARRPGSPEVINIPIPSRSKSAPEGVEAVVRRSRVEFKLGAFIASY